MSALEEDDEAFVRDYNVGRQLGYMEALRDMLNKEERILMMVDDSNKENEFQIQTYVVESKHIRTMIEALIRDKKTDQ